MQLQWEICSLKCLNHDQVRLKSKWTKSSTEKAGKERQGELQEGGKEKIIKIKAENIY